MKKNALWTIALIPPFLVCCNTNNLDNEESIQVKEFQPVNISMYAKESNPYDSLGKFQNQILDIYISKNYSYTSLEEIFSEVEHLVETYGNQKSLNSTLALEDLKQIVDDPDYSLNTFISNSDMSEPAKKSFSDFVMALIEIKEVDYNIIYSVIDEYEQSVMGNEKFTDNDKEILLSTVALIRYSYIFRDKRKDKDWETSVGNFASKFRGVLYDTTTAVIMSVTMEVYQSVNQ